jgi:DNA-binding NarL/FixJ family response regulator
LQLEATDSHISANYIEKAQSIIQQAMNRARTTLGDPRRAISDLRLETEVGFDLIGEASDGAEAIEIARELQPDIILMDLRMPGMDGLAATEHLRQEQPHIAIVILTTFNEDELMRRGLGLGAI